MKYPYQPKTDLRNHADTIKHMEEANSTGKPVKGLISLTPLKDLNKFDVAQGFDTEYMHFYVAGVGQQITNLLLKKLNSADIEYLNDEHKKIRSPNQVGNHNKSLLERGIWKAKDWENWVLHTSVPVLSLKLPENYIRYWILLVESLHILLGTDITYQDLKKAKKDLNEFVKLTEEYFTVKSMTINVHFLTHCANAVYNWGVCR